jgi:hypothetical protein
VIYHRECPYPSIGVLKRSLRPEESTVQKFFIMVSFKYIALAQENQAQHPEINDGLPGSPSIQQRFHRFTTANLPRIPPSLSLATTILCLAAVAGFIASKVFIWSLGGACDQPSLLPQAFFPNCTLDQAHFSALWGLIRHSWQAINHLRRWRRIHA